MSDYPEQVDESGGAGGGFINFLPTILWQRRWLIIPPFIVLSIAGIAVAFLLPTSYRSTATLLVESQELPMNVVSSPLNTIIDQRISKIRQQVTSRGDLISLIEQNNLYPDERRTRPLSEVVEAMRKATEIAAVESDVGQATSAAGTTNTIAFKMSYDYRDPVKAQAVMQSFVNRFLDIDTTNMEEQAVNTVSFLQDQATRMQDQIKQLEGQITGIKSRNGIALSTSGMPTLPESGTYEAQIAQLQAENRSLLLQVDRVKDPMVAQAELALAAARSTYAEGHPDVIRAKQRLDELRLIDKAEGEAPQVALVRNQVDANNATIAALNRARAANAARASVALTAQSRAPVVMEQVMQIENRANQLRLQYGEIAENVLKAQNSARMAQERKGERLTVVEPPVVPDKPFWPDRPLLILGGIGAGLGLGLVLALLMEIILRPIRGVDQVKNLGLEPLAVVPQFKTPRRGLFAGFRRGGAVPADAAA